MEFVNELDQPIEEIRRELEFARAVTALMMVIKADFEETKSRRAELRFEARNDRVTQELDRLAS